MKSRRPSLSSSIDEFAVAEFTSPRLGPTGPALAAVFESPPLMQFSPLVLLKPGTNAQPVFMADGIGGDVGNLAPLAKSVQSQAPIYGIQARGLDGADEPFERIEDMAEFNLEAIKQVQPVGPYRLIGYSAGGLVALEMALRLSERREQVSLLVLLETYPYMSYWPIGTRIRVFVRLALHHASALARMPMRQASRQIARRLGRMKEYLLPGRVQGSARPPPSGVLLSPSVARVRDKSYVAWERYQPKFYHAKIRFVKASVSSGYPDDPDAVWRELAEAFEVETVPGDHLGMVRSHFESLATVLSRYIAESSG